ncbi:hypothetical protein HMPREF0742_01002 [Rothia aeria F0184]|uniref:Uncharacterized protein n=1 Tax=Rothia aeria F0184 TaxID=888019 RepID=U7V5C0_9MICC|nr:hypothetical protein HMPREF0742_01002 [Rothia aeria F0184]
MKVHECPELWTVRGIRILATTGLLDAAFRFLRLCPENCQQIQRLKPSKRACF